jgi:hypothetical protein
MLTNRVRSATTLSLKVRTAVLHLLLITVAFMVNLATHLHAVGLPSATPPLEKRNAWRVQAASSPGSISALKYRTVVDRYCVSCHNDRLRTANFVLESKVTNLEDVGRSAEVWEKVLQKLRTRAMPPPGSPRPDEATYGALISWLGRELDSSAAANSNPGRPPIHRLNRTEYANVIRDLLDLEIDVRSLLPADDLAYGFDNNANTLKVTPALLERYMSAAFRVSRAAIGDPTMQATVDRYTVPSLLRQDDRASEALPLGTRGGMALRYHFSLDAEYVIRVRLLPSTARTTAEQVEVRVDGDRIKLFTIDGQRLGGPRPEGSERNPPLEVRFVAKAGARTVTVALVKKFIEPEGLAPARMPVGSVSFRDSGIAGIEVDGPYNAQGPGDTPSRRRIFVCHDQTDACIKRILSTLARRAYRRPVNQKDLKPLVDLYEVGRATGGFEAGVQRALERMLVDPEFLFRVERDPVDVATGQPYRLSDLELASRLSFFLWSSLPDDQLLDLAARRQLTDESVLRGEVRRMLADPRADALVINFAAQWLHLRNMRAVAPDAKEFPEFDDNLREAFQRETELLVQSQLSEDRGVPELLTADYTFVNERLARHYGMKNVYGPRFRRVPVTDDARKGLLGQGSILTVTSYPNRTSPVLRGKWLLENILGSPPPPPPPNVPALEENTDSSRPRSVRERMEEHRKNAVCASCHRRMDPLGFALENFDAIGKWRSTTEGGEPVDASGTLPDGTALDGPTGLRSVLEAHREEFVITVTSKLLTYAVGRGLEYYDGPAIRAILRHAGPDYRWSSIILGIVTSPAFQMRARREP